MKKIEKDVHQEIIIKNSRFITHLFLVETKSDIDSHLENLKQKYKDASHICYAYRLTDEQKASDDKEPSGTAGIPILNVLEKKDLYLTLAVVIRYFGGIKLGRSGLVRAYTKAVTETLEQTKISEWKEAYLIEITFPYEKQKKIDHLVEEDCILHKTYEEQITYLLKIEKKRLSNIVELDIPYHIVNTCFL